MPPFSTMHTSHGAWGGACTAPATAQRGALSGTIGASIMAPWVRSLEGRGGRVHARHRMRDLRVDAAGAATAVVADGPDGPCVRAHAGHLGVEFRV